MMIERRPGLTFLAHLILILGVLVVAFPVFITFIGSTQTAEQVSTSNPLSLWPGSNLIESYRLGVNAYVVKPVDFDKFVKAVSGLGLFWAVINETPPGSVRKRD